MKKFGAIIATITLALTSVLPVLAAEAPTITPPSACQPIYGGGTTCITTDTVSINKTVQNPKSKSFVDNLGDTDPKYTPNQTVAFKIEIVNKSGKVLKNIKVDDLFPSSVNFDKGPGKFDTKTQILTFTVDSLEKDEIRTFDVTGKVAATVSDITCVANQVTATVGNKTSVDTANFCITAGADTAQSTKFPTPIQSATTISKGGIIASPTPMSKPTLPNITKGGKIVYATPQAKQIPSTGPEAISLLVLIPAGLSGFILRRKTTKQ